MLPDTGTVIREFDAQNGESIIDKKNRVIRFASGALREMSAYGALRDAPRDEYECAKLKLEFWQLKTAQAELHFSTQKQHFADGNPGVLGTGQNGALCEMAHSKEQVNAVMTKLKDEVTRSREALAKAEKDLDRVEPQHVKDRRAQIASNQAAHGEATADLDQYTL
ncbi:hypothetical protein ACWPKS_08520 [Coraliomargarita sp. W4R72]